MSLFFLLVLVIVFTLHFSSKIDIPFQYGSLRLSAASLHVAIPIAHFVQSVAIRIVKGIEMGLSASCRHGCYLVKVGVRSQEVSQLKKEFLVPLLMIDAVAICHTEL